MKMNKTYPLVIVSALAFMPATAISETFSYTYISASYGIFSSEIDGIPEDLEGDGITISGAFNITSNFGVSASYDTYSADVTSGGSTLNADGSGPNVGVFFHTPVSDATDFILGADIIRGTVDIKVDGASFPSEDTNGNAIYAGTK